MKKPFIRRKRIIVAVCCAMMLLASVSGVVFASSGGEHEEAPKGWVATDTYRIMNFAVLFIGLFLLLRKPVAKSLNSRIENIKTQLADLEEKKKGAEKELADYNEKIKLLDKEAEKIVDEYIRQGKEAKDRILKEAEQAAEKLEEQAKRNIDYEFKRVKLQLQDEIFEEALAKAEGIIKSGITDDDQERLVDEYLEKVVVQ